MNVKHENGLVYAEIIPGAWRCLGKPFDALIAVCREHLGFKVRPNDYMPTLMGRDLGIESAQASRVRRGTEPMPNAWLLRFHVYSGLPLDLLEQIAGVKSMIQPHHNARPLETK